MEWMGIEKAPKDGTQILAEILTGYYQVVAWWDGQWRENTNSLALRQPPKQWAEIKAAKAIETGTAETGTGSVHESAVACDLPKE